MPRSTPTILIVLIAALLAIPASLHASKKGSEYIIVSGGPALQAQERYRVPADHHDKWWGNFIRSARIRISQLRDQYGPSYNITWLVYRPGYVTRASEDGAPLIANIESVRDKYNVKLVWYSKGQDVINYLNRGMNRGTYKIVGFEYFGHSNKHAFIFDYSNQILGASKAWLHEDDFKLINRKAFDKKANVRSYGCHTAESMSAAYRPADLARPLRPLPLRAALL
ncbi:MAG: hypothetical protein AAGD22_15080, partial [Verrucomicrobiota bacterium]